MVQMKEITLTKIKPHFRGVFIYFFFDLIGVLEARGAMILLHPGHVLFEVEL